METRDLNACCKQHEEMDVVPQVRDQLDSNSEVSNNIVKEAIVPKDDKCEDDLVKSDVVMDDKGGVEGIIKPKVGMEFETVDDAYNFYNQFGRLRGFSIRKHNSTKDKKTGLVKMRKFVCSNEGFRRVDKRDSNVRHHRDETRTGCLGYMMVVLGENGKYCVTIFNDDHNHPLVDQDKTHMLRSQRKLALSQAAGDDDCDQSGKKPKQGDENAGVLPVNYKYYLRSKRMKAIEMSDADGLLSYFRRKKVEDRMFFYSIQVDIDDCITNIFWADGGMLIDYEHFGDVVCFDTTYRTNGYSRPFAPFIGINHHKQIVMFGAALLFDETAESFGWLFRTFCDAMGGKKPQTILTDEDKIMSTAIEEEFPGTVHRICAWHIFQNALEHLNHVFHDSKSFYDDFSKCMYDYDEEEDFLAAWDKMLEQYELRDNTWLTKLFNEKEKWALVYGRSTFSADIISALRNGSMNVELKKYLDPENKITDFFDHFERLLDDRRNAESEANFSMAQSSPHTKLPVSILKHAADVYTLKIFKMFETEYANGLDWQVEETSDVGTMKKYFVFNQKGRKHIVTFDPTDESITCSCKKFEFVGILCGHALKATIHKLKRIPTKYILKRWTREAACSLKLSSSECKPKALSSRYSVLLRGFVRIAAKAAESEERFECAAKLTELMLSEIEKISRNKGQLDNLIGEECVVDEVVREDNDVEVMVDNAQSKEVDEIKRKENCHDGHWMENCLEKGSLKRRRKKLSKPTSTIPSNSSPNPMHYHAPNHPPTLISQVPYGNGANPVHYHVPTHPSAFISHGPYGSEMMPVYYNDQYHASSHPSTLISQENLRANYFQHFPQKSSEDRQGPSKK
eukprot:TRINITY_DN5037_c1_g1_i3.p1 TRINITY_DN5037_c1_g1~~TRINITY_DN5037_c1_g1_i3.p1  ORF type:complete len:852 (-),score=138.98 TRINITY_DN5037_c1_g1_i3:305-2860(-)